ncbi:peptidase S1, partial [Mycobacterium tuberculosis]
MAKLARVVGLVQEEQPSDMTNHPRYSPPPQQPGTPGYAQGQQQTYSQQF